ncbi:MAG: exosortase/archaeosortase family protein [Candidatus Bathyarchaeia archaeon]
MSKMQRKLFNFPKIIQISWLAKVAAITMATVAIFYQDLNLVFTDALQNESTSHLIIIPALFVYLVYRKRKMLKAVTQIEHKHERREIRHIPLIGGILLSATAILLYWHGSYTFTPLEYHTLAFPIFVAGLTLILFNLQTLRQLAFPIAFLIFLMPPPSEILYTLGATLSIISSEASNALATAFGISSKITSAYGNPTIVITRPNGATLNFTVDIACSGIYSLIGFLIFAVFIAYLTRDKTLKKLAIIITGIPIIYAFNIIRITIILMLGYYYGEELALQTFHLLGGWALIFLCAILLLLVSEKIFKAQIFKSPIVNCPSCTLNLPTENFCLTCGRLLKFPTKSINKLEITKIVAVVFAATLLMWIQAPVFALAETKPIVIVNTTSGHQVTTEILPQIHGYTLTFAYRDKDFEKIAKQDMSLLYLYSPTNQSEEVIWVAIEIAATMSSLHRWEVCLITWPLSQGYQVRVTQNEMKDIKLNENPPVIGRYFAFTYKDTNQTQAVLYWFEEGQFTVNQTSQHKYVKISVIAFPDSIEKLPSIETQLTAVARHIVGHWQPIKTWSQIVMLISQSGLTLAAITTAILVAAIFIYILESQKWKKANTNAYNKLSEINKQTVDMVKETENKGIATTLSKIAENYKEKTGEPITENQLLNMLVEVEKIGIVKRAIANYQDEPIVIWKTQIN